MTRRIKVIQVITRLVRGGAPHIVLEIVRLLDPRRFDPLLVMGPETGCEGSLFHRLGEYGIRNRVVSSLGREIEPFRDAVAMRELVSLFREERPHVVHTHTYKAGVVGTLAARLANVPRRIFSPHGHIFAPRSYIPGVPRNGVKLAFLRELTRTAAACSHSVTAVSSVDRDDQIDLGLAPRRKIAVIPNGIDCDRFQPVSESGRREARRQLGVGPEEWVIGTVGRLAAEKGHALLVDAFARIQHTKAVLVIVGSGDQESELRKRASLVGRKIRFTGVLESREILPAFDLYVQPSHYESQGLSILEAMATRLPVVATRVGGVPDVVIDGETGLLVPSGDPQALSAACDRLEREQSLRERLAAAGRLRVERHFSLGAMAARYERLYLAPADL